MASLSLTFKPISPFSHLLRRNSKPFFTYTYKNNLKPANISCKRSTFTTVDQGGDVSRGWGQPEGRIRLSGEAVAGKKKAFWEKRWNYLDVTRAVVFTGVHVLSLMAPFQFNWAAARVALALYIVTAYGLTLGYHRNLAHQSYKCPKWLEYLFVTCGTLALQGDPIKWVSNHRYHHEFSDTERDPHSPIVEGFWFSYLGWIFHTDGIAEKCGGLENVSDLIEQPFYRFLQKTHILNNVALGILLYMWGGLPFFLWGMGVRNVLVYHATFMGNTVCHLLGRRVWNTRDSSTNIWWLALPTMGESWHNNHHAFESSARHGLEWWQLDLTWYAISFLQAIGLATHVKLPTPAQMRDLALPP